MVAAETRIKPVTHNGMTTVGTCLTANCGCSMLYIGIQFTPQDIFCIERNKKGTEDEKRKRKMFLFLILCLQDSLIIDLALKPQLFTCVGFKTACSF